MCALNCLLYPTLCFWFKEIFCGKSRDCIYANIIFKKELSQYNAVLIIYLQKLFLKCFYCLFLLFMLLNIDFQTALKARSCCLFLHIQEVLLWTHQGICFHRGRSPRGPQLTIGPYGKLPSTSRSYFCAWKRRTRDWKVTQICPSTFGHTHGV